MPKSHAAKVSQIDPFCVDVHFSEGVRKAFRSLAAAVHFSEHFDPDMRDILDEWASGERTTVYNVLIAFPAIAGEAAKHIAATHDERAQHALTELSSMMAEPAHSFTLTLDRKVAKG
jgi:hypothetical protein